MFLAMIDGWRGTVWRLLDVRDFGKQTAVWRPIQAVCPRWLALAVFVFSGAASAAGLPDTGQTTCYDGSAMVACSEANSGNAAHYPGQDGRFGRDAKATAGTLTKVGGGAAGFDYTKVANNGSELTSGAALGAGASDWACTRDNITGLIWEVKTPSVKPWEVRTLRCKDHSYTWYNSDASTNGGNAGAVGGGYCQTAGRCDTEKFVTDVNAAALCGYTDWRLPSLRELATLVHAGAQKPSIDTDYFPNTVASYFWSASPYSRNDMYAWYIRFDYGDSYAYEKRYGNFNVRLVRGEQF